MSSLPVAKDMQLTEAECEVARARLNRWTMETACGCWVWVGRVLNTGYAQLKLGTRLYMAHRAAWAVTHDGACPGGEWTVDHTCHIRLCCNPAHLRIVTRAENWAENRQYQQHLAGHPTRGARRRG